MFLPLCVCVFLIWGEGGSTPSCRKLTSVSEVEVIFITS